MTQEQINDVALAARMAAIGQANKHGDRCVFAIVVCGLDVGSGMAVQSNVKGSKPADVVRILQNGIAALQNTNGGLIILSVLALLFGAAAFGVAASGCGSVEATDHVERQDTGPDAAPAGGAGGAAAGGAGGGGAAGAAGVAGGADAGTAGAAGATGGAAAGGQGAGAAGMTGGAGGAGMTGGAGGGSCAPHPTGALCYQCPAPAPTCADPHRGTWACCDQAGLQACDPLWCSGPKS